MFKGKLIRRHVQRTSQMSLASPRHQVQESDPRHQARWAGWGHTRGSAQQGRCAPRPQAQVSKAFVQVSLGQAVSFLFQLSIHT